MSTDAGSVRVNIFNQTYSLRSANGDGAHVQRVARLVDERMRAVADGLAVHDVAKVAVLTALNLADELEGLKSFYETELREVLERARAEEGPEPEPEPEAFVRPEPAGEPVSAAPEPEPAQEEQSWFDAIFDSDAPPARTGDERLSSHLTSRLRSQVSSRLRRLRQPSPGNSITEGEGEA
ncbi:MAG TPA: cell division protein ZapA [Pyrinomonadaceae bacterium]